VPGLLLVSDPPGGADLDEGQLTTHGFRDAGSAQGIHRFERFHVEHPVT
jgi:hypothetical protein